MSCAYGNVPGNVDGRMCVTPGCASYGADLPTPTGLKWMRTDNAKKIVLPDNDISRNKYPPLLRGAPSKMESSTIKEGHGIPAPEMSPLEAIPTNVGVNIWPNRSESVSTGSTNSLLGGKLGEIGGRLRYKQNKADHSRQRGAKVRVELRSRRIILKWIAPLSNQHKRKSEAMATRSKNPRRIRKVAQSSRSLSSRSSRSNNRHRSPVSASKFSCIGSNTSGSPGPCSSDGSSSRNAIIGKAQGADIPDR